VWVPGEIGKQKRAIANARTVGKKDGKAFVFEQNSEGVRIWRKA
jgi:hypothetical protein